MTQNLRLAEVRATADDELQQLWHEDFNNLIITAIADAEHKARRATGRLLRGPWFTRWYDAVLQAEAELASRWESMTYTDDPRAQKTEWRVRKIRARLHEARALFRQRVKNAGADGGQDGHRLRRVDVTIGAWLYKLHHDEGMAIREELSHRWNITKPVWAEYSAVDGIDHLRHLAHQGVLGMPVTEQVKALTRLDDKEFRDVVADDTRDSDGTTRVGELRHPVLLNDWLAALQQLKDMNIALARVRLESDELAPVDFAELAGLGEEGARAMLNARRFYRAVLARCEEWKVVVFEQTRRGERAQREGLRPWHRVQDGVYTELIRRHPDQAEHMREAVRPYLMADGHLDLRTFTSNVRGAVKRQVLADLGHSPLTR